MISVFQQLRLSVNIQLVILEILSGSSLIAEIESMSNVIC